MQDLDIFNSQISTSVSLIFSALKQSKVDLLNSNDVSSEYSKTWVKDTNRVRLPPVQEEERRHVQRLYLRREVGQGLKNRTQNPRCNSDDCSNRDREIWLM